MGYSQDMQFLTPSELTKAAPGASRLRVKDPSLLDTAAFLRHIERDRGLLPVMGVQGTSHGDSVHGPNKGRHLVVAANKKGEALALLNSHTNHRKAWMGTGYVAYVEEQPLFVMGAVLPVVRWRGFEEPLRELDRWQPTVREIYKQLEKFRLTDEAYDLFVEKFVEAIYFDDHKKPNIETFHSAIHSANALAAMFLLLRKALAGGLPAADPSQRRLKPIQGPDTVMNAANAAFIVAANACWHVERPIVPLPRYHRT